MRRATLGLILAAGLLAAHAAPAAAGGLDLRLGGFFPRGEETLFNDVRELYLVSKDDFYGLYGGVEYNAAVARNVEVGISIDGYSEEVDSSYRDYVRPSGDEIRQQLKLQMIPIGVTVRVLPTSKRARFVPFVGGGIDAVYYQYEEYGDFIDFFDPELPIIADAFEDDGVAFGAHVVGGLRVYLNRDFAIVGEGRYQWSKKDMNEDFSPNAPGLVNTIDLSGWSVTVGLHVRF